MTLLAIESWYANLSASAFRLAPARPYLTSSSHSSETCIISSSRRRVRSRVCPNLCLCFYWGSCIVLSHVCLSRQYTSVTIIRHNGSEESALENALLDTTIKPIFQTLPPELLHVIFSQLPIEDILALRTSCSIFASVGLDYFEDEIPLVFHRDKFRALTEIAEHPKLSKQMRSLFYVVDRCKVKSFERWDRCRT